MKYHVSYSIDLEAETPEAAAIDVDRLLMTTRPKEFQITSPRQPTVFVRVERGEAKRIA